MALAIQKLTIEGSASIRSAEIELTDLNVLVGANGSGKSNFIRTLELLGRIADRELQLGVGLAGGASALLHAPSDTDEMVIGVEAGRERYVATLVGTADDRLIFRGEQVGVLAPGGDRAVLASLGAGHAETLLHDQAATMGPESISDHLLDRLRGCRVFHFHGTSAKSQAKDPGPTADNEFLQPDARNVAAVLWALRENSPVVYRRIVAAIRQVAPFFRDFVLKPESSDRIRLRWRQVDSDTIFSAHQMSDGTLRFVCLATLLLNRALPQVIVLDEPELGLHPFAIVQVAGMLRAAAVSSQVVIATQSVTLLDQFALDDLIVVEREAGSSVFRRPHADELQEWLEDYSLGELWQKNILGGRPVREAA